MEYWSWILTAVGLTGFVLATNKVWWCWYINIACQVLWFTYAIVTEQYGFVVASLAYAVVFTRGAIKWTREHRQKKNYSAAYEGLLNGGILSPNEARVVIREKFESPAKDYDHIIARALDDPVYRAGLRDAAHVCRSQGQDPKLPPCPSTVAAVYLERLAAGRTP